MSGHLENVGKSLEAMALEVVTLEKGDIPAMGKIMNNVCNLEENPDDLGEPAFQELTSALKGYLERLILEEVEDLSPLEEGIVCLQSIHRCMSNQKDFRGDLSSVMKSLGGNGSKKPKRPLDERKDGTNQIQDDQQSSISVNLPCI